VLVHRSSRSADAAGARPGVTSTARWPDGRPKLTTRDWQEGRTKHQERCAFAQDGAPLGCAVLKDGEPFDGVLVDFAGRPPPRR
jgi:hypothetical protein